MKSTRRKLKKIGRLDGLELQTWDSSGKPLFLIWCHECEDMYHRSGTNKPNDVCANILWSHINFESHTKAYEMRIGLDSVNDNNNGVEERIASNKEQIEDATW